MSVALEQPPSLDLCQPPQPLDLELFRGSMQLGEVLLDAGIR